MNIFKRIIKGNKIVSAVIAVLDYNEKNHLTDDTKADIEIIKNAGERLANRIPVYGGLWKVIKECLKNK